jgi:hypothetical protein
MKVPLSWAQLTVGLLPHSGPRWRTPPCSSSWPQAVKEASATIPLDGATQGLVHPCHNQNMKGECSSHDKVSPADGGAVAKNQPPLRAVSCSPRRIADVSPCSASPHRARVGATVKWAHRLADCCHGSARCTASACACPRDGEDPDGGLHHHSDLGQEVGPSSQPRGGPG